MQASTPAFHDFLLQVLEAEQSTVGAYDAGIHHAASPMVRDEWRDARKRVVEHEGRVSMTLRMLGIDLAEVTEGRRLAHAYGVSLIRAIIVADDAARDAAEMAAAQALADLNARCCLNWELLDALVRGRRSDEERILQAAVDAILPQKRSLRTEAADRLRRMWEARLGIGLESHVALAFTDEPDDFDRVSGSAAPA
jgi:hypothetical protein